MTGSLIARTADTRLDAGSAWCVGVIAARTRMQLAPSLLAIARRHQVPVAVLEASVRQHSGRRLSDR